MNIRKFPNLFIAATDTFKEQFGDYYIDRKTDWDNILALLQQTETIIQMDMYDLLKPIVNAEATRKMNSWGLRIVLLIWQVKQELILNG